MWGRVSDPSGRVQLGSVSWADVLRRTEYHLFPSFENPEGWGSPRYITS